jgi:hypothetical protein
VWEELQDLQTPVHPLVLQQTPPLQSPLEQSACWLQNEAPLVESQVLVMPTEQK